MCAERDTSVNALREALQQIESTGCVIKDLDIGLIDFPCMVDDQEIYLCWKLGESEVLHWHELDAGFAGRQSLAASAAES